MFLEEDILSCVGSFDQLCDHKYRQTKTLLRLKPIEGRKEGRKKGKISQL